MGLMLLTWRTVLISAESRCQGVVGVKQISFLSEPVEELWSNSKEVGGVLTNLLPSLLQTAGPTDPIVVSINTKNENSQICL